MPDFQQLLEDAIERLPEPATPPFETIVARARQRRVRRVVSASAVLTILIVAGILLVPRTISGHKGTAVITPVAPNPSPTPTPTPSGLPGTDAITTLAPAVTVDRSGTSGVELGTPPQDTNAISLQLTCLSDGAFSFADGESGVCQAGASKGVARAEVVEIVLPLQRGQHSTTIRAVANLSWKLIATYVKRTPVPLGVNASGQTYGSTANGDNPDLVAVVATNGKQGYVYATGLITPQPANPSEALAWQQTPQPPKVVPVYESDGKTQIGEFALTPIPATTPR
jgi:hypothetical protein